MALFRWRRPVLAIVLLLVARGSGAAPADVVVPTEKLRNAPDRVEEFIDWGLEMFVHWSFDSQLGSVISHSMVGASEKYLDRYINELPKTFQPKQYDPDEWMAVAKLAGAKYMVLTTKHHSVRSALLKVSPTAKQHREKVGPRKVDVAAA
ncbi:MAG: alpha-L-fucosidase [Planctomycetota bacterium]